jgi:hypothetical protein
LTYVNHVAVAQKICRAGGATSGNARSAAATEAVFPSTGSENPKTDIRFIEFELPSGDAEDNFNVRRHKLPMPLMEVIHLLPRQPIFKKTDYGTSLLVLISKSRQVTGREFLKADL